MGGVLPYKWEAYCGVSLSSKLRSQESAAMLMGGVLPYNTNGGRTAVQIEGVLPYFSDKWGLGFPKRCPILPSISRAHKHPVAEQSRKRKGMLGHLSGNLRAD